MIQIPDIINYKLTLFLVKNTNWEIDSENTLLLYLFENEQIAFVKYLLQTNKFNVNAKDKAKYTLMDKAIENGDIGFAKYLHETCQVKIEKPKT